VSRKKEKPLCPRCGNPVSWWEKYERKGRVYYIAVHYLGYSSEGGKIKKKVKKCYLGPKEYEYVSRLHSRERMTLKGLGEEDRVIDYLEAIITYFENNPIGPDFSLKLVKKLEELLERLRRYGQQGGNK